VQVLNGWVQGMGWPPCGKTMVHWFSTRERGVTVSVWNTAHNVGGALVATFALAGVALFHDWHAKFYFNALIAAVVAIGVHFLLEDTPQSRGLPPVEEYRNDFPPDYSEANERTLDFRQIFFSAVLRNRYLWAIAVANAFCYFVRYGVENWIPAYLETAKGFSFKQSSIGWSLYEWSAIPGTIACGWISDRWFAGRRHRFSHLRADHDHRAPVARSRAEESGGHRRGLHRAFRLRIRLGDRGDRSRLDRRPVRLGRRVRHHGGLLPAHHAVQRAHARASGAEHAARRGRNS